MKRHLALRDLSRDHHHALVVAQRLKRAEGSTAPTAQAAFLDYWQAEGRRHFRLEEETLLPACAGLIDADHPLIARVLTDHVRIRHLADRLSADEHTQLELEHELGRLLERHIRLEERELFALIESTLPEPELQRLVSALAH